MLVGADNDPWAVETHTASVGGIGYTGDLTDPADFLEHLAGWGIQAADLVVGGVPCQPFSRAGHSKLKDLIRAGLRADDDPRAALWQSFMRVVEHLHPRVVLIENVPDLPRWDDGAVLIGFLESFRDLGYSVDARVIDCFLYGVPQHRARLFIVATKDTGSFSWPESTGEFTSLRDAIGDLPVVPGGQRHEELRYRPRRPLTQFQKRMRAACRAVVRRDVIHDHITRAVRADDLEAFELLGEGQTYADLPKRLRRYRSDIFTDKYKRLAWNELSRTITAHLAKDGYWYIHPEQHRTLSVREAARIQTFPARAGTASINRAVDLIEAEPGLPWTVGDLASRAGLSTRALQYGFAALTGMSPMAYLRQVRLQRADAELRAADSAARGVASIASRWGFTNFGRFAAAYRMRYGRTPSETLRRTG